ncbi:MAG: hypothetical protein U0792_05225 [Gemmataceae bacterium]
MIALLIALSMLVLLGCVSPFESGEAGQTSEPMLTISQVCRRIPGARGNDRVTPSTITRWILSGCPARNGVRVKLQATRAGGRWLVGQKSLDAFFLALAATDAVPQSPTIQQKPRSEAQRQAASEAAAKELKRRGA